MKPSRNFHYIVPIYREWSRSTEFNGLPENTTGARRRRSSAAANSVQVISQSCFSDSIPPQIAATLTVLTKCMHAPYF
jgi:hypothetical protein